MTRGATHRFIPNPLTADQAGRISGTIVLDEATGNEAALTLNYTTNKATSGNDTGLLINMTDTSSPGTSLMLNVQKGGTSVFCVDGTNSRVGISTESPGSKLDVRGQIRFTEGGSYSAATINSGVITYDSVGGDLVLAARSSGGSTTVAIRTSSSGTDSEKMRITSTGTVGIGTATPNANAILDVTSTTKAFMPPRMTTVQKAAIATPTAGMQVYDTTLNKMCVYTGAAWETITSA